MTELQLEMGDAENKKALEALLLSNVELEELEIAISQFNMFEALGTVRQELRHSDFLAFLLNPSQNHGLGDLFAKRFLQRAAALSSAENLISPIELDIWDLDDVEVLREWRHIDILLIDQQHHLAVIIENKVDSSEHSSQLQRYYNEVTNSYPDYRVFGVYLTPGADLCSDSNYVPVSYSLICETLEDLIRLRQSVMGTDIVLAMRHYVQMVRRHIVSDPAIADLCRRIYQKHQKALDLIFEFRFDQQASLSDYLQSLVKANPGYLLDSATKSAVLFVPKEWDVPILQQCKGWGRSNRMLRFVVDNDPDQIKLRLIIGPGPLEIRQKLFSIAQANPQVFNVNMKIGANWCTVFREPLITKKVYEESSSKELEDTVTKRWADFGNTKLPVIMKILKNQEWIWQALSITNKHTDMINASEHHNP